MANAVVNAIGTQAAQPASGTVTLSTKSWVQYPYFFLEFDLDAAQIPVTDAAGSGSYGALKLFDFNEGAISFHGCRQNYTAFAEGAALTGAAGDASFDIGVGSVAIAAAADGALATTDDNIGTEVNITLSGGTGTGTGRHRQRGNRRHHDRPRSCAQLVRYCRDHRCKFDHRCNRHHHCCWRVPWRRLIIRVKAVD
jgi:hypothetical protein